MAVGFILRLEGSQCLVEQHAERAEPPGCRVHAEHAACLECVCVCTVPGVLPDGGRASQHGCDITGVECEQWDDLLGGWVG